MESTLLSSSTLSVSKSFISHSTPVTSHVHRLFSPIRPSETARLRLSCSGSARVRSGPLLSRRWARLQCAASAEPLFASGGGGGSGGIDGNGGGGDGDGAAEGDEGKSTAVATGADDPLALRSDVIVLHVGGMTCGGCAASVKKILESQPQVSLAEVDFDADTAIVWPVSEAKIAPNWQKDLGEALAKHLTSCGFKSNIKDEGNVEEQNQS